MKIEDYKDDEEVKKPDKPEKKIIKQEKLYEPEPIDDIEYPENTPPVVGRLGPTEEELKERRKLIDKLRKELIVDEPIIYTKADEYKKVSDLTLHEQEDEFVKCKINPIYFICTYLTIFDQTQGDGGLIVPFKLFPFQVDLINDYIKHRFVIPNKYRQAGISTATCAYIAWYVMFNRNRSVAIVANKQMMAENELMKDVVDFIDGCPAFLRPKTGKLEKSDKKGNKSGKDLKDTQALKKYDNGSELAAFSSKGLRGYTPTLLYWDEVAWTEKNDVFWTATRPTLQTGGRAIMVSCVTKDTFLYTDKGIKQIKDFIPNEELGAHIINEYSILGKDKLRKGNIFFNNGFVNTLKIKTTYSELESSYNHKYWAYKVKDNKYGIYKASELEIGDYISIQYGMNIWGYNDDCSDFKPTNSSSIKNIFNPNTITKDIAYFIGLYISEGYMFNVDKYGKRHTTQITITCGDSLKLIFDNIGFKYRFDGIHYTINSKNMGEFFEYIGFDLSKKAPQKIIPSRLLEMSKENIIAMIQGIMDGDGWCSYNEKKNKLRVGIELSSKELINQIRIILGNFGILTEYQEVLTPITERVKVTSMQYRLIANNSNALKYLTDIGFIFERKQNKINNYKPDTLTHNGVTDNIPNGNVLIKNIYKTIKKRGLLIELRNKGIKLDCVVEKRIDNPKPISRKLFLNFINSEKHKISDNILSELKPIISDNIRWVKIKSIEQSKNFTYDFSLPNDIPEENDFHHSVIYNQVLGYQTPNGLDAVYYKTFEEARKDKNNFYAVELWWFNDPRYNKNLSWYKNKGQQDEIKIGDDDFSYEKRLQLKYDGWEAGSPWLESQIKEANGDIRKIKQEILCVFGEALITIKNKLTGVIESITISDFYNRLELQKNSC